MSEQIKPVDPDDAIIWPDGTWCFRHELVTMTHMSDDYRIIPVDTLDYHHFFHDQQA
jgi:hypothetical protein